ncbi:hypothetical protein JW988_03265 [Candidatus Bathyarchaeota archaeon]|nr:hypothetical protein [Candidatus Bathyarchaeota archaeon]
MKRKVATSYFIMALLFSALTNVMSVDYATANFMFARLHLPEITINSNGTVTPETGYIHRAGNVYTLTANITQKYSVQIERSNIVFDGAGHTIDVAVPGIFDVDGCTGFYEDVGITLSGVNNVNVKNVNVSSNNIYTIYLHGSSNCHIIGVTTNKLVRISGSFNKITESNVGIAIFDGSNNLITRSNISDLLVGGPSNVFFKNNFYLTDYPAFFADNFWDDGSVGNYWSNYTIKYPNASEVGNTGIGDTPHVIQREWYTTKEYPDVKNVDNYPLMYPWGAPAVALLGMQNATYSGDCFLNFTVSKSTVWLGYSLDGQGNVTVSGNVTLSGLSSGLHNLTVYAEDAFGYVGVSETASFIVTDPELFPTTLIVTASVATVIVVGIGLLVYFKKRKH